MSEQSESPKKIWLEYSPDEQRLHLTDELVWTGYLTEYVRADYHERLASTLEHMTDEFHRLAKDYEYASGAGDIHPMHQELIEMAYGVLAQLEAEKGGE